MIEVQNTSRTVIKRRKTLEDTRSFESNLRRIKYREELIIDGSIVNVSEKLVYTPWLDYEESNRAQDDIQEINSILQIVDLPNSCIVKNNEVVSSDDDQGQSTDQTIEN